MSDKMDREYGQIISTDSEPKEVTLKDFESEGITQRELKWLRAHPQAWRKAMGKLRVECIKVRPFSESEEKVTPRKIYDLTRARTHKTHVPSMKSIGLEAGLQEQRITSHFGRDTQGKEKPLRAAHTLASIGMPWPENFDSIVGTIVMDALTTSGYNFGGILLSLDRKIRHIAESNPMLASELSQIHQQINERTGGDWWNRENEIREQLATLATKIHQFEKQHTPPLNTAYEIKSERALTPLQCAQTLDKLARSIEQLRKRDPGSASDLYDLLVEIQDHVKQNGWDQAGRELLQSLANNNQLK